MCWDIFEIWLRWQFVVDLILLSPTRSPLNMLWFLQASSLHAIQVEVKVIPHCPFWVFPIVNAVSKKSSLSHPFDGSPMWTLDLLNVFFITYDLEIVEIIAFCWWAAILLNTKRYSRKNHLCMATLGKHLLDWADAVSYPRHPEFTPSQWHTGLPQAIRKLPQGPNPIGTLVPHLRWFGKQNM